MGQRILGVDPGAIDQLTYRLGFIRDALDVKEFSYNDQVFGDWDLINAFRSFINGWSDGRGRIVQGVEVSIKALTAAKQGYEEYDAARAAQFGPSGGR